MSLSQRISIDREAWFALSALWIIGTLIGVVIGYAWLTSVVASFAFTFLAGVTYGTSSDRNEQMKHPATALFVLGGGALFSGLLFAVDCLNGNSAIHQALSLSRCMAAPSMFGFVLTATIAGTTVFLAALILLRALITNIWGRNG
jgi:hypothetical protein